MVAGGFIRSQQIHKLLRLAGSGLFGGSSSRARDIRRLSRLITTHFRAQVCADVES
jgi:hypothetical protein